MTPEDLAVFSVTNDFYFWSGIVLGLIISGFLKIILRLFIIRIQRPSRIVLRNLNGKMEKGTSQEYLYLFQGEYYTLEHRDFLIKQRVKKPKLLSHLELLFVLLLLFLAVIFFSMTFQNYGFGI